jgi:hypothetical protein
MADVLINVRQRRYRREQVRPLAAPRVGLDASTFSGVYMRPNLQSNGEVPAQGTLCTSPDIWVAGMTPVANWQTALATSASYTADSGNNVTLNVDNYFYLRACNGLTTAQDRTVALYYAPSNVIQEPSRWEPNVILTDQGNTAANIRALPAGAVGVGDQTFVWPRVPPPPGGADHYCLIAQVNDAQNSNPLPSVENLLDLSALVTNNLGFGWKNLNLVPYNGVAFEYSEMLTIPLNAPRRTNYSIGVAPVGWVGYYVTITCSQTDANGNPISLNTAKIVQDGAGLVVPVCPLEAGFNASINVVITNPDNRGGPAPNAKVPLSCSYAPSSSTSEAAEAVRRGLVDWNFTFIANRLRPERITPVLAIPIGSVTSQIH